MPATDSDLPSMEDQQAVKDEAVSQSVPSSALGPSFGDAAMENKAVSVASNGCSSSLSSPAEASLAKPAVASPTSLERSVETSPPTSQIASAADSLTCTGTSLVNISESLPPSVVPASKFGSPEPDQDFPSVLTFKGVSVTLENNSVWKQFNICGTEMILTKPGRRMFPYCRYRLAGLDPHQKYSLVLSIVPTDHYRYRWSSMKWEVAGQAEHQSQGLIRAFSHHYSPARGSDWMGGLVSFYKLKLTNNPQLQEGHIILQSMHRYIPRLHVIPVLEGDMHAPDQPFIMGPESMTFTFPQTEFMAVTTYQNFRITQLKINHNPFAKGFREDGNNPRLNRVPAETRFVMTDVQLPVLQPAEELRESKEAEVDGSPTPQKPSAPLSHEPETRLVLKPIMYTPTSKDETFARYDRGDLGELVLVQKSPRSEPKEEKREDVTPNKQARISGTAEAACVTSSASTPRLSPGYRKRKKRRMTRWRATAASPTFHHKPSLSVATQPELDDVEGLLFVSFTTKEALEIHVRDRPANTASSESPVSTGMSAPLKDRELGTPEMEEEKIALLEASLLKDLQVLKHRQVIHPLLREVGLKLSSLDPNISIDLHYLGVRLPLPPLNLPEQDSDGAAVCPDNERLPFISRTGKTSDMTKIKGWRNKFIKRDETSPSNCDASQKNLSAFCSNMLDEYLESEAQQISERAAAFSTNPEGSVAYQLPAKSSSYVKTLASVLKHQRAASKAPVAINRPCPLSHKPLLYSALKSPAPPLPSSVTPVQFPQQPALTHTPPGPGPEVGAHAASNSSSHGLSTFQAVVSQRPVSSGLSPAVTRRPSGLIRFQRKLLQMEMEALDQGLTRTQLGPDRLSVALSVILTKEMPYTDASMDHQHPKHIAARPECGQQFCRLGCVCSSLNSPRRAPLHCRQPECMFECSCFKRMIAKQLTSQDSEQKIQPIFSMTYKGHEGHRPGSRSKKLWNPNIRDVDSEPLFAPKSSCVVLTKSAKHNSASRVTQQIPEEEKDPVYRYFESFMTCARVREFNSKPPPEVTIEPKTLETSTPIASAKKTTDSEPKTYFRTVTPFKKAGQTTSNESHARKQIEIQSACQWGKDRKMVLEALCRRMKQSRLPRRFRIGPYCIRLVTKIFIRKPSGSVITYRVNISKPTNASDDEDDFDNSDEEKSASHSSLGEVDTDEEDGLYEAPGLRVGVAPFLGGVLPAGRLRARRKPAGCQVDGLIQVNGKCYNQARLLLGNMGSLHPANRLAAYVTGRLHGVSNISSQSSQKPEPSHKVNTSAALHINAAGTIVHPVVTAKQTTDLKIQTLSPTIQFLQPDFWKKVATTLAQVPKSSTTVKPIQIITPSQHNPVNVFQKKCTSFPVSLTVSPSLKTPSFLGQRGTYSFRICPPANQSTKVQNLPGVSLPGGFTLIQLPKPANDEAKKSEAKGPTDTESAADSDVKCPSLDTSNGAKRLSSVRSVEAAPELRSDGEIQSHQLDVNNVAARKEESNLDFSVKDESSDFSDYCADGDEAEELVDIETVEEEKQEMAIAKLRKTALKASLGSGYSIDYIRSQLNTQPPADDEQATGDNRQRRRNHTALERQRRCEQRFRFDLLQKILKSDPGVPRLRILSLTLKEIQSLTETSKRLEEEKRKLTEQQSVYLKRLCVLSGKSEEKIKHKLKEVYEKQKAREKSQIWRPFFSSLLLSRAAFLQAEEAKLKPTLSVVHMDPSQANLHTTGGQNYFHQIAPWLQSNLDKAQAGNNTHQTTSWPQPKAPAQNNIHWTTTQLQPNLVKAQAQNNVQQTTSGLQPKTPAQNSVYQTAPKHEQNVESTSAKTCINTQLPAAQSCSKAVTSPAQVEVSAPSLQTQNQTGNLVSAVQHGQHREGESLPEVPADPAQVITPTSSQSPAQAGAAKSQVPAAEDGASPVSSTPEIPAPPACLPPAISLPLIRSKTGRIILPSSLRPTRQGVYTLMFLKPRQEGEEDEINSSSSTQPSDMDSSMNQGLSDSESSCTPEEQKTLQSSNSESKPSHSGFLRFKPGELVHKSKLETETPLRRSRGRPRKHTVGEDAGRKETSIPIDAAKNGNDSEKVTLKMAKTKANGTSGTVDSNSVPVKRRRGRPPKNWSFKPWSPTVKSGSNPTSADRDFTSPALRTTKTLSTSRPLTRGALGKDFPSAKKRSWIDVEQELEPELDSE